MIPLTRGKAHCRSPASTMRTSCNGGSTSTQAFLLRLKLWKIAASATGHSMELTDKGRNRAVTVLRPSAAAMVSHTGSTSAPPRAKTGAPPASMPAQLLRRSRVASRGRDGWSG